MLDLTLGPSFKVKQWFTGFGELSIRWIQICIGLRCVGVVFFPPWSSNTSTVMTIFEVKIGVFSSQLTYCSMTSVQLDTLIKLKEDF